MTTPATGQPRPTMRDLLLSAQDRIAPFVPKGMDIEEVLQLCHMAVRKNPDLLKCKGETIVHSVCTILSWGLVIGQTAYLVPYGRTCTPVADYKGLAELMVRSGAVRHVQARCVYENEPFRCIYGLEPVLEHERYADEQARGALKGAYCILTLPGGIKEFEYLPIADIERIRKKHSKQWGPDKVKDCPDWYAEKTAVRKTAKLAAKNPRMRGVMKVIEEDAAIELAGVEDVTPTTIVTTPAPARALGAGAMQPVATDARAPAFQETARVVTAPPIEQHHIDEANRALEEHGHLAPLFEADDGHHPPF